MCDKQAIRYAEASVCRTNVSLKLEQLHIGIVINFSLKTLKEFLHSVVNSEIKVANFSTKRRYHDAIPIKGRISEILRGGGTLIISFNFLWIWTQAQTINDIAQIIQLRLTKMVFRATDPKPRI